MTTAVDDLIARLKQAEIALGDPLDVPRTTRAYTAYWEQRKRLASAISLLMNLPNDLARAQARLDDLLQRRAEVVAQQEDLERQIAAFIDPMTLRDGRERDREHERQRDLRRRLERLREGSLLRSRDATYEPIGYLDQQIAERTTERERLSGNLDVCLKEAEQLLAPTLEDAAAHDATAQHAAAS